VSALRSSRCTPYHFGLRKTLGRAAWTYPPPRRLWTAPPRSPTAVDPRPPWWLLSLDTGTGDGRPGCRDLPSPPPPPPWRRHTTHALCALASRRVCRRLPRPQPRLPRLPPPQCIQRNVKVNSCGKNLDEARTCAMQGSSGLNASVSRDKPAARTSRVHRARPIHPRSASSCAARVQQTRPSVCTTVRAGGTGRVCTASAAIQARDAHVWWEGRAAVAVHACGRFHGSDTPRNVLEG